MKRHTIHAKYKICQLASLNCCEGRVHGSYGKRKWSDTCDRMWTQYSYLHYNETMIKYVIWPCLLQLRKSMLFT